MPPTLCKVLMICVVLACTMAAPFYQCTMCTFGTESSTNFTQHVIRIHKNDPRFKVYCDNGNCGFSTKNWGSYKVHVSRFHRDIAIANDEELDENDIAAMDIDDQYPEPDIEVYTDEQYKMLFASYMLNLETSLRLSEKAVNVVAENTQYLIAHQLRLQKPLGHS